MLEELMKEPFIFDDWTVGFSGQLDHTSCDKESHLAIWSPINMHYKCSHCGKVVPKDIEVASEMIFTATWRGDSFESALKNYMADSIQAAWKKELEGRTFWKVINDKLSSDN